MSQASDDERDMRPEYDIRGGVRGKYFERYQQAANITIGITFEESSFVAKNTASARSVGRVTGTASYPPPAPSPKIQIGGSLAEAHAG
jgi:hypothetical protein